MNQVIASMPFGDALELSVCVDASLVVKWLVSEADSTEALTVLERLIHGSTQMVAPYLIDYEVASVLRRIAARGEVAVDEALARVALLEMLPIRRLHSPFLLRRAWEIASRYGLPTVYDACYVALAEITGARLYTCDEALISALGGKSDLIVNPMR
jgi:predicted nucleic acid-binding protein